MDDMTSLILKKLDDLEKKIDGMARDGCAKARLHELADDNQGEIFRRLRDVETAQAEGKGKLAVAMMIAGAAIAAFFAWIGRAI